MPTSETEQIQVQGPGEGAQVSQETLPGQQTEPFKTCTFCGHVWARREDFLADPTVVVVGYQSYSADLVLGLFLFNHMDCETTLAIHARDFAELYTGPIYKRAMSGTEGCLGHCSDQQDLEPCPNECECAWVREVMQVVKGWQKQAVQAT